VRPGVIVRSEQSEDRAQVRSINTQAFGRPDEADLVDRLRDEGVMLLSLVAEIGGQPVGHVLFSRMWIATSEGEIPAVALAPMAVLPDWQRRGVGGALIRAGLAMLRDRGESVAIVLGHHDYYPRFGFSCDAAQYLESPFPPEAFMALELRAGALAGVRGAVRYPPAFGC
jgi:putative acetyltransferase